MKGSIIDIGIITRPNPDGTVEGVITMKSDSNANCFDVLAWHTDGKPTKQEVMTDVIRHIEMMKTDMERCLSILKEKQQKEK